MVATHYGPRAAYLFSAEGHFSPPGTECPPPKVRAYFSAGGEIFVSRPALAYFPAPRRRIFRPSRATVAEIFSVFFGCLRESSRPEDTQLKKYEKIFRPRPRAARNIFSYFFDCVSSGGGNIFPPGAEYFLYFPLREGRLAGWLVG